MEVLLSVGCRFFYNVWILTGSSGTSCSLWVGGGAGWADLHRQVLAGKSSPQRHDDLPMDPSRTKGLGFVNSMTNKGCIAGLFLAPYLFLIISASPLLRFCFMFIPSAIWLYVYILNKVLTLEEQKALSGYVFDYLIPWPASVVASVPSPLFKSCCSAVHQDFSAFI